MDEGGKMKEKMGEIWRRKMYFLQRGIKVEKEKEENIWRRKKYFIAEGGGSREGIRG